MFILQKNLTRYSGLQIDRLQYKHSRIEEHYQAFQLSCVHPQSKHGLCQRLLNIYLAPPSDNTRLVCSKPCQHSSMCEQRNALCELTSERARLWSLRCTFRLRLNQNAFDLSEADKEHHKGLSFSGLDPAAVERNS